MAAFLHASESGSNHVPDFNMKGPDSLIAGRPRVLHIIPALFEKAGGIVGGAERYAFEMARFMAEVTPTTLLSFGDKDREESVGPLCIKVLGGVYYPRGQRSNPITLRLIPEVVKHDVIHCHQQHIAASSLAAAAGRICGRRVVVSDLGGGGWDVSSYVSTDRWYHRHLHISEYSRRVFGHGASSWAHVIYGGVDTNKFSPGPWEGVPRPVMFVGRLMPHKGVDFLVRAMPPDAPLRLIGQAYHPEYEKELRRLSEGKQVEFLADCDDAMLVDSYRSALCVVLPSVYKTMYGEASAIPELLGQTLLEGMSCGIPAICTDVASMPEVVEDGRTGFVVPPNSPEALRDKIQWLYEHPAEARQMGENGRQRVLRLFTWPAVVRRCLELYAA